MVAGSKLREEAELPSWCRELVLGALEMSLLGLFESCDLESQFASSERQFCCSWVHLSLLVFSQVFWPVCAR